MATKAPRELQRGDRLISTQGPLEIAWIEQPELSAFIHVTFADGSTVRIDSTIMVEVAE